jgi:H2-forming N5,N10-methylenetetrahydromethanopterin dehydrogenase-like enzyme
MKELIMCYRIYTDAQKDVSRLSSRKEESVFTPQEDIGVRKTSPLTSESAVAAMIQKLFTPFGKDEGGTKTADDVEMKRVKPEAEKVG